MNHRKQAQCAYWNGMRTATTALLLLAICGAATGQTGKVTAEKPALYRVPSMFERHRDALGSRTVTAGREQTVYVGEFVDAVRGTSGAARAIHQAPFSVRLEGFDGAGSALSFDGARANRALGRTEELLLETFVMDSAEGVLAAVQGPAAVRFLGGRYRPDPALFPDYSGPLHDIFQIATPVLTRSDGVTRIKLHYFDSATGLLHRTRYEDDTIVPSVRVETRFSNWQMRDGSFYPGRIARYEDDRLMFSFTIVTVAAGPKTDSGMFR